MPILRNPSDELLAATVIRAGDLLRGLRRRDVRAAMIALKFNGEEYQKGWRLYNEVTGVPARIDDFDVTAPPADPIFDLFKFLDEWDDTNLPILGGILLEASEKVYDYFEEVLNAKKGAESISLIKRLCTLELDLREGRAQTGAGRVVEEAALAALARLGYGPEVFDDLRQKVESLTSAELELSEAPSEAPSGLPSEEELAAETRARRFALYLWYEKWATIIQKKGFPRRLLRFIGMTPQGRPPGIKTEARPKKPEEPRPEEKK